VRPALCSAALLAVVFSCTKAEPVGPDDTPPFWVPGMVYRAPHEASARGLIDRRGIIHSHSYYSHDACDNAPVNDAGVYDQTCFEDFRRGICQSGHDFYFLTDHPEHFTEHDFPDTLLYRSDRGDTLIDHGAGPTGNWLACPNGAPPVLLMAGTESNTMMPVGLEAHLPGRGDVYNSPDGGAIDAVKAQGAAALIAHTELWTADQLTTLPIDGFEMYNLHANSIVNAATVADWVLKIDATMFDGLPDPNLFLTGYKLEDPRYLTTWGSVLAGGTRRVTTMGTDCHRNTFPEIAQDGERIDSYRRMMVMFSNHLLVTPKSDGTFDDRDLKDALRAGRLYGAFDFMGYPQGFDYVALEDGQVREMGGEVKVGSQLKVTMPRIQRFDPNAIQPVVTMHIFQAIAGGWNDVAQSTGDTLTFTTTAPGAYRAEVRMIPKHLRPYMGVRQDLIHDERPWVYSNAIYVK
jgi:hypothetical protein